MTYTTAPPNWYSDPEVPGGLRYWDGAAWTWHRVAPPGLPPDQYGGYPYGGYQYGGNPYGGNPYGGWGMPTWKGASLGRPPQGSGSLADPGRRLVARLLDALVLLPVFVVLAVVTLLIAAPHFGPLFPQLPNYSPMPNGSAATAIPTPGFVWLYLTIFGCVLAMGLVMLAYQTVMVARFGRTLGMRWLRIRPLGTDGVPLGWARSFVRALIYWLFTFVGWIGLINPLWCLWDDQHQCLHDKVADSIVVND